MITLRTLNDLVNHIRLHLEEEPEGVRGHLADMPAPDIADLLNRLTLAEAGTVLALVPFPTAVAVSEQPSLRRRGPLMEQLDPKLAGQILEHMADDERTNVIQEMGAHAHRRLLPLLSQAVQAEVQRLLQYKERIAGTIMTTEFVRLTPEMTVEQAASSHSLRGVRQGGAAVLPPGIVDLHSIFISFG